MRRSAGGGRCVGADGRLPHLGELSQTELSQTKLSQTKGRTHVGGYLGPLAAVFAWYGSVAAVVSPTWKRTVLPVFPARA